MAVLRGAALPTPRQGATVTSQDGTSFADYPGRTESDRRLVMLLGDQSLDADGYGTRGYYSGTLLWVSRRDAAALVRAGRARDVDPNAPPPDGALLTR